MPLIYTYINEFCESVIKDELKKLAEQILLHIVTWKCGAVAVEIVRTLILKFPSFYHKLTEFILQNIRKIIQKYPFVLRDPSLVECEFEMLQVLSKAADDDYLGKVSTC